jgi:hypothetical protein
VTTIHLGSGVDSAIKSISESLSVIAARPIPVDEMRMFIEEMWESDGLTPEDYAELLVRHFDIRERRT